MRWFFSIEKAVRAHVRQAYPYLLADLFSLIFGAIKKEYTEDNLYTNIHYMQEQMLKGIDIENCDLDTLERGLKNEIEEWIKKEKEIQDENIRYLNQQN